MGSEGETQKESTRVNSTDWLLPAPTKGRLIDTIGTKRLSIAGTSGAGKTYSVMRLCELLYARKSPFVVLDTVGNFWGLRVAKDGKKPGLDIPVLGGLHGDLEIQAEAGGLVAEFLQQTGTSLVVDLSLLDEDDRATFVTGFARRLLELWKRRRQVLTVIVDEAQDIVPEMLSSKGDAKMRRAMHTLGLQGRNFGIGLFLLTQAPQNVLKRLFNLADLLIAGRIGGEHERKAVERWVRQKGIGKEAVEELPTLPTGTLYAWSPAWLEFFGKVETSARWTFDSSKTPELGDIPIEAGALAPVDLKKLGMALHALAPEPEPEPALTVVKSEGRGKKANMKKRREAPGAVATVPALTAAHPNDVLLRQVLERLDVHERQVAELVSRIEVELERCADELEVSERFDRVAAEISDLRIELQEGSTLIGQRIQEGVQKVVDSVIVGHVRDLGQKRERSAAATVHDSVKSTRRAPVKLLPATPSPKPSLRDALVKPRGSVTDRASFNAADISDDYLYNLLDTAVANPGVTRRELAVLAGVSLGSSTFGLAVTLLIRETFLSEESRQLTPTAAGVRRAQPPEVSKGRPLWQYWLRQVGEYGEGLLEAMKRCRRPLTRKQLAVESERSHDSSSFNQMIVRLKKLGLITERSRQVFFDEFQKGAFGL